MTWMDCRRTGMGHQNVRDTLFTMRLTTDNEVIIAHVSICKVARACNPDLIIASQCLGSWN